ncbi:phenazine biosynthesis protein PhzF [Burkholderia sp. Nafp2/4-1b]|uniref:PhzF family phenazine biosynthesis protein n=1 Tax=Burkholderia sp. Nafp2/4-1b TaxID=2116686 RepID=UPI000EF8FD07|nr:PhzF family phenazine biosynthesis protein [Burkholderia sp. Nafp2/4-1b]RKT99054.1 phenazine biosynthesis protein PhzF [Burkholderia sp. Nafp2/4-1b]
MSNVPFKQVDVFTNVRFKGNPVAVVLRADGLTSEQMQQIANWTNLSETTFVIPKSNVDADYRVRIFTPGGELPFAGHPTIGTAHALLEAGMIEARDGNLVQECGAGLIKLKVTHEDGERWISFDLPAPAVAPLDDTQRTELEAILGTPLKPEFNPCLIDVGARWIVAQLPDARAVLSTQPDLSRMKVQDINAKATGVVIFGEYESPDRARIEVRAFAPAVGVSEDPVCGSGNGSVGVFIRHTGQAAHFGSEFLSSQGAKVGRAGLLRLAVSENSIRVGGVAVTCIDGLLST